MKKRICSLFLTLCLLLAILPTAILPANAETEGIYTYTVANGEATITGCAESASGAITVPAVLGGYPVTSIGEYAFDLHSELTSVTLPNSLKSIGYGAFQDCWKLSAVNIPDGLEKINSYAFNRCRALTSVSIPESVTSIGNSVFILCSKLTGISVAAANPNYSSENGVLLNKNKTILMQYPGGKAGDYTLPSSVKTISNYAFYSCKELTSVTIPDSVESIGECAFGECSALKNAHIGNGVKSIAYYAFGYCTEMESVSIGTGIKTIGEYAFTDCSKLTSITLPDNTESIGKKAFRNCSRLTSAYIGKSITIIDEELFYGCADLTGITIPASVTTIGRNAFYGCTGLTSVTIPNTVQILDKYAFYDCNKLENVTISNSITTISDYAFFNCNSLTNVNIPAGVTTIGYYAFQDCTGLTSVTIPRKVTSIGDKAFYNCTGLATAVFSGDAPTSFGVSVFANCAQAFAITYFDNTAGWTTPTWNGYTTQPQHVHSYTAIVTQPTCTERGYTTYTCACGDSYVDEDSYVDALGHTEAIDEAVAATCSATGLTEGKHCSVCNEITVAQTIVEKLPHTEVIDLAVAPTCSATGLTEGKHCSVCNEITVAQTIVEKLPHTEVVDQAVAATCTATGLTEGKHCSVCHEITVAQTIVEKLPHTEVIDEAVSATCTQSGLTAGSHCSVCNDILVAQETVDALGHDWGEGVVTIEPTATENGERTFTCSRCNETRTEEIPELGEIILPFTDVPDGKWFTEAVKFAYVGGLFGGTSTTEFSPNGNMTRGMLVTVLWRLDGKPTPEGENTFSDVEAGKYYTLAVTWAAESGVVGGVGAGKFNPDGNVTREQIAAIIYRYADFKGYATDKRADLSAFPDNGKVSAWAKTALSWANAEGLIGGTVQNGATVLDPQGNATRAQVAIILMRYVQNIIGIE